MIPTGFFVDEIAEEKSFKKTCIMIIGVFLSLTEKNWNTITFFSQLKTLIRFWDKNLYS